ncbi:MAG TPA: SPOR domain-containing protein [Terriglobales bacterium]|nr:SPOR domain-containing protein [Terriglobales bacterium]
MAASQDTEITLGTGRMLVLFFGLVGICALFFGLGYSLGKSSGSKPVAAAEGQQPAKAEPKPAGKPNAPAKPSAGDLTFYQAVKQSDTDAQPGRASSAADNSDSPVAAATSAGVAPQPLVGTIDSGSYVVQVAAVSKKDDAEALLSALKRKSYAVFIASNEPHDRLYHVQVGPFGNVKDAEAARAKLVADGYNPILKK